MATLTVNESELFLLRQGILNSLTVTYEQNAKLASMMEPNDNTSLLARYYQKRINKLETIVAKLNDLLRG